MILADIGWPKQRPLVQFLPPAESEEEIQLLKTAIYEEVYRQRLKQAEDKWIDDYIDGRVEYESQDNLLRRWQYRAEESAKTAAQRATKVTWQKIRKEVWERDRGICQVCGIVLSKHIYDCGHIIDRLVGGSDRPSNLVAMCTVCNQLKPFTETREAYLDWARTGGPVWSAMDQVAEMQGLEALRDPQEQLQQFPVVFEIYLLKYFYCDENGYLQRITA